MKTTETLLQAEKNNAGEIQKETKALKGLKYLLILFMLSWIAILPSCVATVRTPEPSVTIETHHHRMFHRNHYHESHIEYRDQDDHHR